MSTLAIRRALDLSEAAATAAGLLDPGRLVAALAPAGAATSMRGLGNPRGARDPGGAGDPGDPGGPQIAEVLDAVLRGTGLDREALIAPGQQRSLVRARQLAMYLIRELCPGTPLPAIGYLLDRHHTTVLYGCRRAEVLLRRDRPFREAYQRIRCALMPKVRKARVRG